VVRRSRSRFSRLGDEDLLTFQEVAVMLRISLRSIYRMVNQYGLETVRLGPQCVRVRMGDLRNYLSQRTIVY